MKNSQGITGVGGAPKVAATNTGKPSRRVDYKGAKALKEALQKLPASRPDKVARAKALAADPNYPSSRVINTLSRLLAKELRNRSLTARKESGRAQCDTDKE
jgi:hypothetical protein